MARRRRSAWFSPPTPRIIAHRGLSAGAHREPDVPENTLPAFRRALEAGASHLETDVRATADGAAVLAHDPDLSRVAGIASEVGDLTLDELRAVPLADGTRFCTLSELLAELPEARVNLDVKSADAIAPTIAAIRDADAAERVLVTSFSGRRRRSALRGLPAGTATSASSGAALFALVGARLGLGILPRLALRGVDAIQIPERYGPFSISTPGVIRSLHGAGIEVHYWTVNAPEAMRRLVHDGADGIITDRSDLAVLALA